MAWKDQLLPASFRGVPFAVADSEVLFGRRNQLHEYPLRDEPYAEDLGKKAREYTINAFVIGDDYIGSRDLLISSIENNQTPGTLIHPTLGTITVIPKDCRVIYSNQEGGLERFVLTFIEAGSNQFPSSLGDTQGLVDLLSDNAIADILSNFVDTFQVTSFPDFVSTSAQSIASNFASTMLSALGIGLPSTDLYSDYVASVNSFSSTISADVSDASTFGGNISSLVTGLTDVYDDPIDAYKAQKSLTSFGDDLLTVSETTPSRTQQAVNQAALVNLVKNSALVEMVRTTSQMDYASRQDAIATRDEVDELMEDSLLALADDGNDDQYNTMSTARAAMVKDINARGANLAVLATVRTYDPIPALVFAYNQYEDATRDEEIIDRNGIRNPVFIPADTDIEVLI